MPVHLALVALSVLAGAWFAGDAPVSSQQVLLLGVASGLTGLLLGRGPRLRALCCCICALCAGTTSTRALPTGPQLEGWTHAVGEIVRRHDGWLVLETSAGPIALSGVDAGLGETAAVFGRARPLQITPASTWSREKGALHAGIRTVVQVKRQAVLDPRSPSPFLHSQHRAFLDRVVLGRSTPLSEDEEALLRSTGTRHLLAISGLHVGLISALGALVLGGIGRVLALFWRPRCLFLLPAIGGCTAALLYASNAGFPTSTIRALCVLALGWGCWLIGRTPRPWRLFWLALTLTVLFAPQRVKTLSFGLSFSAAAGVLQSLAWTKEIPPDLHPVVRWLLKAMSVSLGAQLGTLAWSAWVFQELPLLGAFCQPCGRAHGRGSYSACRAPKLGRSSWSRISHRGSLRGLLGRLGAAPRPSPAPCCWVLGRSRTPRGHLLHAPTECLAAGLCSLSWLKGPSRPRTHQHPL